MIHNWLKKMVGTGQFQQKKYSLCNTPHLYEIKHRYPTYQNNCICECHTKENHNDANKMQ